MNFRPAIFQVLRQQLVTEEGYEERHILRELLQNAESAYASQGGPTPTLRFFHVGSEPAGTTARWRVSATHCGRSFNAQDHLGRERNDVRRIVSSGANQQNTAGEVGRFNRGFKSVFSLTDRVAVRSGPYDFEVEDLLLLHPPVPTADAAPSAETRFSFSCSKIQAEKLFGGTVGTRAFSIFHAASFVFLRYVDEVTLENAGECQRWGLRRTPPKVNRDDDDGTGWSEVVVTAEGPADGEPEERFLVFTGRTAQPRRFGVAVRLDPLGSPRPIESVWNQLFLTFPTATAGPGGLLVNADFDTDHGRIDVRQSATNGGLIKAALQAVCTRVRERLRDDTMTPAEWLGWARTLRLRKMTEWVQATFPGDPLNLVKDVLRETGLALLQRVPHRGMLAPLTGLIQPSKLMRKIAATDLGVEWEIDDSRWLTPDTEAEVTGIGLSADNEFKLCDLARECRSNPARANQVLADLRSSSFAATIGLDVVGQGEWRNAVDSLLATSPSAPVVFPVAIQPGFDFDRLDLLTVLAWWEQNVRPDDYILEGTLWELFGAPEPDAATRLATVRQQLTAPATPEGRALWYRVLGFACLLGAGRRTESLRKFWRERLAPVDFWNRTAGGTFAAADAVFEEVIHAEFRNATAAGEDAVYWRRVFYDVRKVRHLVYENDFAGVVLELAADPVGAARLPEFLRTGALPAGQPPWRGVLGQSAGSPIFFVLRELRRLGIVAHAGLDLSAFYVCTPVRRLAARLGWITPELAARYDFESLLDASGQISAAAMAAGATGAGVFRRWHDIPLLHYQLSHP